MDTKKKVHLNSNLNLHTKLQNLKAVIFTKRKLGHTSTKDKMNTSQKSLTPSNLQTHQQLAMKDLKLQYS